MTFEEWELTASPELRADRIWRMRTYRLACYLSEVGWADAERLSRDTRTQDIAGQLVRALGSIRANLAEGYSRASGRDRARVFEYGLGSARESREWYRHVSAVLGPQTVSDRCVVLDEITRLLLAIIPRERDRKITRDHG
jgi:four helix bundle protein